MDHGLFLVSQCIGTYLCHNLIFSLDIVNGGAQCRMPGLLSWWYSGLQRDEEPTVPPWSFGSVNHNFPKDVAGLPWLGSRSPAVGRGG